MKWPMFVRADGRIEYACECGVSHGSTTHGCCGKRCCADPTFPFNNILAVMFGPPGSGKDTEIARLGLGVYAVTPDQMRLQYGIPQPGNPSLGEGSWVIPQGNDAKVWGSLEYVVAYRLARGYPTIINATTCNPRSLKDWQDMAKRFLARFVVVDVAPGITLDALIERNNARPVLARVPVQVIKTMHEKAERIRSKPADYLVANTLNFFVNLLAARELYLGDAK